MLNSLFGYHDGPQLVRLDEGIIKTTTLRLSLLQSAPARKPCHAAFSVG